MYRNLFLLIQALSLVAFSGKKKSYPEEMVVNIYHGKETIEAKILKTPEKKKGKYEVYSKRYGNLSINENQIKGPAFENDFEMEFCENVGGPPTNSSTIRNRIKVNRNVTNVTYFGPKDVGEYVYDFWMDEALTGIYGYEFQIFVGHGGHHQFAKLSIEPQEIVFNCQDKPILVFVSKIGKKEEDELGFAVERSWINPEVHHWKEGNFELTLEILDDDPLVLEKSVKPGVHVIVVTFKARKVGEPQVVLEKPLLKKGKKMRPDKEEDIQQEEKEEKSNNSLAPLPTTNFGEERDPAQPVGGIDGASGSGFSTRGVSNDVKEDIEEEEENENIQIEDIEFCDIEDPDPIADSLAEKLREMESRSEKDFLIIQQLQAEISTLKDEKKNSRYEMQRLESRARKEEQKYVKELKELILENLKYSREIKGLKEEMAQLRNQLEMEKQKNAKNQNESRLLSARVDDLRMDIKKNKEVGTVVEKEIVDLAKEKEEKYKSEIAILERQMRSQKVDFTSKLIVLKAERDILTQHLEESERNTSELTKSNVHFTQLNQDLRIGSDQASKQVQELEGKIAQLAESNIYLLKLNHQFNMQSHHMLPYYPASDHEHQIFVHPDQIRFGHNSIGKYFGNKRKNTIEKRSIDDTQRALINHELNYMILFQSRPMRAVIWDSGKGAAIFATNGNRRLQCMKVFIENLRRNGNQMWKKILVPVTLEAYDREMHGKALSTKNHGQSVTVHDNR